jgi:hypothetical protein
MDAAAQLQAVRDAGYLTFMVGHANIVGSISSSGQPQWGREIEVSSGHLGRLGPILKLFGHIHKPQEISGALYLGSVCRLDFGECEEKRYIVADIADDSSYTYESKPIDVAPMWHIDGVLDRDGFHFEHDDWMCQACRGTSDGVVDPLHPEDGVLACVTCAGTGQRQSWAGADVRVRYKYKASERSVLNESTVRDLFKTALRLKVESVVIPDRELRAPAVALAKTLPDKLAAYFKVEALSPAVAEKLAALEQQDVDQVLGGVAIALAEIEQNPKVMVAA